MSGFPDVLLRDVLDYFNLDELLFAAMPVSRFWRSSAIEHPRYWRFITLDQESTYERRVHSEDLFFLRLARAGAKPVDLRIWMKDPSAVLDTLARELHHIHCLTMDADIMHGGSIFQSMRDTPAPILESLNLSFCDTPESQQLITIPPVLFAGKAPVLTQIGLANSALPSDGGLPAWLSKVSTVLYRIWRTQPLVLQFPNILAHWPRLRDLRLSGMIGLDNPAFLQAGTWARLEFLHFLVRALDTLPLLHIPCIRIMNIFPFYADHLVLIANSLANPGGLLDVTVRANSSDKSAATVPLVIKSLSDAGKWRGRWTEGSLPRDAPGTHPDDFVTALQHPPLLERIASLCISLDSWDILVGRGFLSQFPEVESLVLTLELWFIDWHEAWHAPARTATLALQRLRRITFRFEHHGPAYRTPVLQLAHLSEFATQQLSGARLPLRLSLEGVESRGAPEEFADVFRYEMYEL